MQSAKREAESPFSLRACPRLPGQRFYQSPANEFYLCENNYPLTRAESNEGDVSFLLKSDDKQEWFSLADAENLSSKEEIFLTFDDIANKDQLGLILNFRQTLMTTWFIYSARGIYARLDRDPLLGELKPGAEAIAEAIRKRDKARIMPTGVLALNALGLSTQVPVNVVYLTDGAARKIDLGKRKILFKKSAPKNLSAIGKISALVIQALKEIGKDKATAEEVQLILSKLEKEEPYRLEHDIRLAPEWIRIIMRKALKSKTDE